MFTDTIFARRTGEVQRLDVCRSGGGESAEVLLTSVHNYHSQTHRLTLDEAEALGRDLLRRVQDCRKEAKRKARR